MKPATVLFLGLISVYSPAIAIPTKTIQERGTTTYCGQWDSVQTGDYTVYNDLWGMSAAKSGSQCFGVDGLSGSTLKWHTTYTLSLLPILILLRVLKSLIATNICHYTFSSTSLVSDYSNSWSWSSLPSGQDSVKSYANAVVSLTPTPLSRIKSIPSTWKYTQTGSNVVADISYDMFTSSSAGGAHEFEVMIWYAQSTMKSEAIIRESSSYAWIYEDCSSSAIPRPALPQIKNIL